MLRKGYLQGVFIEELKNRFLCKVKVDGEDILCYIPSSCRLSNFVDLTGKTVLLAPNASEYARTRYSVYAIKINGQYYLLNMSQTNKIIESNIKKKRFSFLGKRETVKLEYKIDDYKSDLYVEDTQTIIEVKSILSFDRDAIFPTVYSQRAIDQLEKLSNLIDKGYQVCYMFVSLNPKVKIVNINKDVPEFYRLFVECVNKGMNYNGYAVKLQDTYPIIHARVNVCL